MAEVLAEEAVQLDKSSLNKSNIAYSRLSMKIAKELLSSSPSLADLENKFVELATQWTSKAESKPAFCSLEGVAYAVNAVKVQSISEAGHIMVTVPFYCEFERGMAATEDNPNGEDSPLQKLEEALFLLAYNEKISMEIVFVNDVIAEKKDEKDGGSARLFKKSLLGYAKSNELANSLEKGPEVGEEDFECMKLLDGRLSVKFDSCELEACKGSKYESPEEKRKRLENRDENGKLRSRKGAAVLTGMELEAPAEYADKPQRVVRCLVDGDSAHPVASFVGDAAYSILEKGNTAYLGNMKHACTCVSRPDEGEGASGGSTLTKVMNRKLFFSGFIVPFLFPELSLKYKYTGTTQLPVKSFRGDIDFAKAKLTTVQPNVDLGMLALLCSTLNAAGGSIDSGAVTIRDNVASSTMTTDDLNSEWTKTYGPIFTSAVGLCRVLKPADFKDLQESVVKFIESMTLNHYTVLFGAEAATNADVVALFSTMKKFVGAEDRSAVLQEITSFLEKIFASKSSSGGSGATFKVVFIRHGESEWNVANIFTGWHDVNLSENGLKEATEAGKCLKEKGYKFDLVFTSVLRRAIRTAWTVCTESENFAMPIINHWRLNERHYGGLQGLNKAETAQKYGDDQVKIWRRSFDVPPPAIEVSDPRHPANDPLYAAVPTQTLPGAESLKLTIDRVLPLWFDQIAPCISAGKNVLVAAHGNSLRAICKFLEGMSEKEVLDFNIPTAVPLVYELDMDLNFVKKYYLMDEAELKKKMEAVANQGKAK